MNSVLTLVCLSGGLQWAGVFLVRDVGALGLPQSPRYFLLCFPGRFPSLELGICTFDLFRIHFPVNEGKGQGSFSPVFSQSFCLLCRCFLFVIMMFCCLPGQLTRFYTLPSHLSILMPSPPGLVHCSEKKITFLKLVWSNLVSCVFIQLLGTDHKFLQAIMCYLFFFVE